MSIFGDFYHKPINFKTSRKERLISQSENWSAAILSGSSDLVSDEEPLKKIISYFILAATLVLVAILVYRLFYLQVIYGQKNLSLANGNRVKTIVLAAPRGAIYDRNGVLLARNTAQFDLVATISQLSRDDENIKKSVGTLAPILNLSEMELIKKIKDILKSDQQTAVVIEKLSREQALKIEENNRFLNGLSVEISPQREYLDDTALSHFIGYIGRISKEEWEANPFYRQVDIVGKNGLEKSYEKDLRGMAGKEQIEVDALGRPVRYLAREEPSSGNNLVLSIDWGLQQKMKESLLAQIQKAGSKSGVALALDPNTGEILAAVNYPSYNGNLFAKGISNSDYQNLLNNKDKPLFNRILNGNYPIGSTAKPFVSIAALSEGVVNASTTIVDKGKIEVPNIYNPSIVYTFKGWKPEGLGPVNVTRAIAWSSDIFFYQVGGGYQGFQGLGVNKLLNWYSKFGFGKKTGVDISDESVGFLPTPEYKQAKTNEPWTVGDTYNISIGQGDFKATPLQLGVATAAIANGGKLIKPHFVKEVNNPQASLVRKTPTEILNPAVAPTEVVNLVKRGMEEAVSGGTACCSIRSEVPVKVAGKTGTAETSSQGFDGKNPTTKPHAWFTAYAPAENPKIVTVVLIEHSGEGSEFAVPVTKDVLKWYFANR